MTQKSKSKSKSNSNSNNDNNNKEYTIIPKVVQDLYHQPQFVQHQDFPGCVGLAETPCEDFKSHQRVRCVL